MPGIRIRKRIDGTIAINPALALGLATEAESFPAMMVVRLIQNHGTLAYHESLTTFDSILRRHSLLVSGKTSVRMDGAEGIRENPFSIPPWFR